MDGYKKGIMWYIISDILINIFTRVLDTVNIKYSLYELTLWT